MTKIYLLLSLIFSNAFPLVMASSTPNCHEAFHFTLAMCEQMERSCERSCHDGDWRDEQTICGYNDGLNIVNCTILCQHSFSRCVEAARDEYQDCRNNASP